MGTPTMSRLTTGRFVTARVMASQKPPCDVSAPLSENLVRKGMVRKLTRSPSSASTAGSSVSVAASDASTTRIAPSASDW